MKEQIIQKTLENGLRVLLKPMHTAPLVSQWVWYQVGSRNERQGITGISHWLEHMMFKGTAQFPGREMDRNISRLGGYWNAMTFLDWTTYFATMPAGQIDLLLQFEADRMVNADFDKAQVEMERGVILSEREGYQNDPMFHLNEAVQKAAFQTHSYGIETIGDVEDLHSITKQDLVRHYRNYYRPENAVLALAGAFDPQEIIARIEKLFQGISAEKKMETVKIPAEPRQMGEQKLEVKGPGDTEFLQIAYHAPKGKDAEFFTLMILDSLLTGASSLNMFGGGISNKTSRLYRALVDQELAVSIAGGVFATIDPFLYTITATVHPNSSAEAVTAVIDSEIARLQHEPPRKEALQRALKQAKALFAYGSESITNQAFWLGFAEMFDSYDWFLSYLDHLAEITPSQIQDLAQEILIPENRVVGVFRPNGGEANHDD